MRQHLCLFFRSFVPIRKKQNNLSALAVQKIMLRRFNSLYPLTAPYEAQRSNKAIDDTKNPFWEDDSFSCLQGMLLFQIVCPDLEKTKKPLAP